MYSFAQRKDTIVIDEPLYAHYLRITDSPHPGKDEIIAGMESNGEKVVSEIILGEYSEDVIFFKQMTHHLIELDESFLEKVTNVFLIRNPEQMISSFAQVIPNVTQKDIGIVRQYELFEKIKSIGQTPIVIDSGEILKNPESVLTKLCNELEIKFYRSMLTWEAGPRKEDGVWAKYWYENVHKSSGFENTITGERKIPEHLNHLYQECLPYYNELYKYSIKA